MEEKRRVLLVIPNLDFGGAQNSFSRLSHLLEPHFDLLLVVFNKANLAPIQLKGSFIELGVSGSGFILGKALRFFQRIIRLRKIKRKFKPHASVSFLEGADYVNILSTIGERIYIYIHGSKLFDKNIAGFIGLIRKRILIPLLYSRANKILVVNEAIADELRNHFKLLNQSFKVMPNFYDFEELNGLASIQPDDLEEAFFKKNKVICISGRLAPEKGIEDFLQIIPVLLKKHPGLRVIIIGDGPQKDMIKAAIVSLGIAYADSVFDMNNDNEATVFFLGYKKNPYAYMSRSTMLALPSFNEGMPNTVVEAMGLGVPVVAADCPYGPRELLGCGKFSGTWPDFNAYGILVPVLHDNEARLLWISAIDQLLDDVFMRKKYKEAGKVRAQEFSYNAMDTHWLKLLNT
ncbi:MAG: glycosyltransferase [Cyclobacteriaceae bacterium]|nr:glycosyltransferase [Cyclobacteriaceae bacterium]